MPTARIPIDLTWSIATGSPGVNVFHARADSLDAFNADFNALSALLEQFYTDIAAVIPNTVTISSQGEATGVGDDTGNTYSMDPWSVAGTSTGGYAPPANTMLVRWSAATGGRSGRGRTYISPITEAIIEANGTPDETARGIVATAAEDLVTSSQGFGNGALGIYSRVEDTFRDFVTSEVPNYFAVLRSRRD